MLTGRSNPTRSDQNTTKTQSIQTSNWSQRNRNELLQPSSCQPDRLCTFTPFSGDSAWDATGQWTSLIKDEAVSLSPRQRTVPGARTPDNFIIPNKKGPLWLHWANQENSTMKRMPSQIVKQWWQALCVESLPSARTASASKSSARNLRMIKQSRLNEWNLTWRLLLLTRLFSMNENSNDTLLQQDEVESFSAWLKRNHLDSGQPWLFYGEDELFEDVIWTLELFQKIQDLN